MLAPQVVHRFGRERFGIQPCESAIDVLNCPAQLLDQLAPRMSQVIHPSRPLSHLAPRFSEYTPSADRVE